ncbi:MAG: hypothetical protein KF763_16260 [Cyclobacteriaceae bacterium]|nr:hypothetical protein [Cyclobacteriaceae bacterium]
MINSLRILLVIFSALLVVRNIGTYMQSVQFEIVEETSSTKEESIPQQQLVLKKIDRYVFIVAPVIPTSTGYPNSQPALTISRWLYHRAILT